MSRFLQFGGGIVNPGPPPPTPAPSRNPSSPPTPAPVPFGSGGVNLGPRPPSPPPTISVEPTTSPTSSPRPTTTITMAPTPGTPFPFLAEGDTSFGFRWFDLYFDAHQHAIRRAPGWSWGQISSGPAPFCYKDMCFDVTDVCNTFNGILLHPWVCSFTEDVIVAGPSCWRGNCTAAGTAACASVSGTTVGVQDGADGPQWCVFNGERSLLGPTCYNGQCFKAELQQACELNNQGVVWNEDHCIFNGYLTSVGPICWNGNCQPWETQRKCNDLGGIAVAEHWCMVPGCDKTVIGPLCSKAPNSQCFEDETIQVCGDAGGTQIGNQFCVLGGTEWTLIGPTSYHTSEIRSETQTFCTELQQPNTTTDVATADDNLDAYFKNFTSHDIGGHFCLVQEKLPTTTPFCGGSSITTGVTGCQPNEGRSFCNRFGGKILGDGFMCSLCDSFRQVVGPLLWNGTLLEGDPDYCEGSFCAIPNLDISNTTNVNLRCPTATPVLNRCEAFGGAIGIGNSSSNITNRTDDDDDDDDGTSSAPRAVGSWILFVFTTIMATTTSWMVE